MFKILTFNMFTNDQLFSKNLNPIFYSKQIARNQEMTKTIIRVAIIVCKIPILIRNALYFELHFQTLLKFSKSKDSFRFTISSSPQC